MLNRVILSFSACVPLVLLAGALSSQAALAANDHSAKRAQIVSHWTPERRAAAIPRDLVIDDRGLGYLRRADGTLVPHGHNIAARAANPTPQARPSGGGNDETGPEISNLNPTGITIGDSYTFSAKVIDTESGVKSVTFVIVLPDGGTQSFSPTGSGDTWSIGLSGFTDSNSWSWYVVAKDGAKRGGNTATSETVSFSVDTGGSGGGGGGGGTGDTIINEQYDRNKLADDEVEWATGRIYFEMPSNKGRKRWAGYVCSGTVVIDGANGRSTVLTAAHCVYDDANKAFARNVLFIPNQNDTTGDRTDSNCGNDPIGCWTPAFGVVDVNWTQNVFPDNIPWDYAFYVVGDIGGHTQGFMQTRSDVLDQETPAMTLSFDPPFVDTPDASDFTHGMGYSYSDDPNFMYCAEDMTTEGTDNWWLPSCGLSGGSSGGPWIQPLTGGAGPVISVNSWGYTSSPGMAGPKLSGTSAECVFIAATDPGAEFLSNASDGDAGYAIDCTP